MESMSQIQIDQEKQDEALKSKAAELEEMEARLAARMKELNN